MSCFSILAHVPFYAAIEVRAISVFVVVFESIRNFAILSTSFDSTQKEREREIMLVSNL